MKRSLSIFIVCLVFFLSCKKTGGDSSSVDLAYDYFPVDTGRTWIYEVDSLVYDDVKQTIDTFYYQYKEIIAETIIDGTGKPVQRIARYFRKSDTDSWVSGNSWVMSRDQMTAQKVQENARYVKLIFPLNERKIWDGNVYNSKGEEEYSIDYFDQPATINGNTFEKTTKVLQIEEVNAIEEIRRYELYARGVGMIYFQSDSINTQPTPSGPKSRGLRYRLTLKSYQ